MASVTVRMEDLETCRRAVCDYGLLYDVEVVSETHADINIYKYPNVIRAFRRVNTIESGEVRDTLLGCLFGYSPRETALFCRQERKTMM